MKNSLIHTETKQIAGNKSITVKIRLNDECKNGHQDFSITGDLIDNTKQGENRFIQSGCIHDEILKHFPEFAIFVRLHLCDYAGVPMCPSANLPYHIKEGKMPNIEICNYYRITTSQLEVIRAVCYDKTAVSLKLIELGVLDQWKKEADEAITLLETLTGEKFLNDSKRSQFTPPTQEEIDTYNERLNTGYFTPEAYAQRKADAIENKIAEMNEGADKSKQEIETDLNIKTQVLRILGRLDVEHSVIVYKHKKEIVMNWHKNSTLDKLSDSDISKLRTELVIPDGYVLV